MSETKMQVILFVLTHVTIMLLAMAIRMTVDIYYLRNRVEALEAKVATVYELDDNNAGTTVVNISGAAPRDSLATPDPTPVE